jgi:hypothetical protein
MQAPSPLALATGCPFEASHARPCPVCRSVADGSTVLQHTPAQDAVHADHMALALAVDLAHAQCLYAERGLHLHMREIIELSDAERLALDAWAVTATPLTQPFAGRTHVIGTFNEVGHQRCTRCGLLISDRRDPDPYTPGTYAGLDCEGDDAGGQR